MGWGVVGRGLLLGMGLLEDKSRRIAACGKGWVGWEWGVMDMSRLVG